MNNRIFHNFSRHIFKLLILHRRCHKFPVRVRFAPSPTGSLHLGGLRTALYNFLYARKHKGKFILRLEDTDQKRIVPGSYENLNSMLQWTGLHPDESPHVGGPYGPYIQSERLEIYKEKSANLLKAGLAYKCFCSETRLDLLRKEAMRNNLNPGYDNKCRHLTKQEIEDCESAGKSFTIRFKIKEGPITFDDIIYKQTSINISGFEGDFIVLKSDGFPTYHFACVVDDHLMEISHVLRGGEWLLSTPKHIMLHNAFGWQPPKFAHLPLLVNSDKTKLSKRQEAIGVEHFKDKGYCPEALLNFLVSAGGGFEKSNYDIIHDLNSLVSLFTLENVSTHPCVLDLQKIEMFNRNHLAQELSNEQSLDKLLIKFRSLLKEKFGERYENEAKNLPDAYVKKILVFYKERLNNLYELLSKDMQYLWASPDVNELLNHLSNLKISEPHLGLKLIESYVSSLSENDFSENNLVKDLKGICKENKLHFPSLMVMLRIVLTGQKLMKVQLENTVPPPIGDGFEDKLDYGLWFPPMYARCRDSLLADGPGVAEILVMLGKKRSLEKIAFILRNIENESMRRTS